MWDASQRLSALVECWRDETRGLLQAERAALALGAKLLALGVAVLAAAAAYGIAAEREQILLGLPVLLWAVVAYTLQVYGDVSAMGAARRHLERRLEATLGERALVYDTVVSPLRDDAGDKSQVATKLLYAGVLISVSVGALWWTPSPDQHGDLVRIVAISFTAFAVGVAGLALWELTRLGGRVETALASTPAGAATSRPNSCCASGHSSKRGLCDLDMGDQPDNERYRELNGDYPIGTELEREDALARTVLTVSLAGGLAASSVAVAAENSEFSVVFFGAAGGLVIPAVAAVLCLSIPGIARDERDYGPWRAIGKKRIFNRLSLAGLVLDLILALTAGFVLALT